LLDGRGRAHRLDQGLVFETRRPAFDKVFFVVILIRIIAPTHAGGHKDRHTEHQQLVPEGCPATICIDDRSWAEARLTWIPAELIERILSWFRRAGRGELNDARQPLDPVLMASHLSFFIARSVLDAGPAQDLIAEYDPGDGAMMRVRRAEPGKYSSAEPFSIVTYRVPPGNMKRLKYAPDNLAGLAAMLEERGIRLFDDLRQRLDAWIAEGAKAAWRLNGRFAVIVEMPIISPRGIQQDGLDHRAFVTARSAGDIAVALGVAEKSPSGLGKVGYAKVIGASTPDEVAIAAIEVQTAEVHLAFEAELAARLAGRSAPDDRKAVLAGAGAIGSLLGDDLAREGRFTWTVIDDDRLLPHNLARHIGRGDRVTHPKANILADHINALFSGPPRATAIAANLFTDGEQRGAIESALHGADLIIDATASVVAARHLSDHPAPGRRASVFFNPAGEAAVLLAEPADRALTLRDLEAQYLGVVLRTERLAEHLGKQAETVGYTGACRASRAATFTPSPKMSPASTIMSPRVIPMRYRIRLSLELSASCLATAVCISIAHLTALRILENSTRKPSPVALANRPSCLAIIGSISAWRRVLCRVIVPVSSAAIKRL
jgi:hypothetical protein